MKCLIIAAGKGTRIRNKGPCKPLVPILGVPLIERIIRSVLEAGIRDIYVVIGYEGEKLEEFLKRLQIKIGQKIHIIENPQWDKENAISVLKAKGHISDNFILVMGDHLFDPQILNEIKDYPLQEDTVLLVVDRDLDNPYIDLRDVTKVRCQDNRLISIGKDIDRFNAYDTGIFLCSPSIFTSVKEVVSETGRTTLTDVIRYMAKRGKVFTYDMGKRYWIDVDDEKALLKAERLILEDLSSKQSDGPISRYINRPISLRISRHICNWSITPNQITLFSFFLSLCGSAIILLGTYLHLLLGAILAQLGSIIDGCDGEIARIKYQRSEYGAWLDAVLDRYQDGFLIFSLTYYGILINPTFFTFLIGFMALIGSYMVSYTAHKYDRIKKGQGLPFKFRIGRDIRIFLIFVFSILNQVIWALTAIAILMNLETGRRIWIMRDQRWDMKRYGGR